MAFTDNFNGASSDTALESWTPSGGTAWTRVDGVANGISVSASGQCGRFNASVNTLYWCDSQGTASHYSQITLKSSQSLSFLVNRATDANNFIGARVYGSRTQLYKRVGGSLFVLGTAAPGTTGDTLRIESNADNEHTVKLNGTQVLVVTDAFNAGQLRQGLCSRESSATFFDDYEAGSLSAPAAPTLNSLAMSNITPTTARATLGLTR